MAKKVDNPKLHDWTETSGHNWRKWLTNAIYVYVSRNEYKKGWEAQFEGRFSDKYYDDIEVAKEEALKLAKKVLAEAQGWL